MMIDHSSDIERITGYGIGSLFVKTREGKLEEIECYKGKSDGKGEGIIYDINSGHFHLIPNDQKNMDEIGDAIARKRLELVKYFKKNNPIKDSEILRFGERGSIFRFLEKTEGRPFSHDGKLFKCLRISKESMLYDMNFMRFFASEDASAPQKTVNCILLSLQFSCEKDASKVCFPKSSKNGKFGTATDIVYYNPQIDFYDSPEDIVNAFCEFIDNVERRCF